MGYEVRLASGGSGGSISREVKLKNGTYPYRVGCGGSGASRYSESLGRDGVTLRASGGCCSSFAERLTASGGGGAISDYYHVQGGAGGSPNGFSGVSLSHNGSDGEHKTFSFSLGNSPASGIAGHGGGCFASYHQCGAYSGGVGGVRITYLGPLEKGDVPMT